MPIVTNPPAGAVIVPNTNVANTNAPTTVTPPDPNVVDPNNTGLNAATNANPTPNAGGQLPVVGLGRVIPGLLQAPTGPSKMEVLPGYPLCVSLPTVLQKMAQSPQAQDTVKHVLAAFQQQTGITVPPALEAVILAHPERIAEAFVVTPQQMSAGFDAANVAARNGTLKPTQPKTRQLDKHVTLEKLDWTKVVRKEPELKEIAPGLFQGDVKSDVPDARAKQSIAAAEIMDRLAGNALTSNKDDFKVTYKGKTFTTVDGFLEALQKSGHKVTAHIDYRAADFGSLKVKNPQAPGGVVDVPAAVLVATGIKDAQGREAVLPALHGELIFKIEGPDLNADFKWFQGVPDTGFFPHDVNRRSSWLGKNTTAEYEGADAIKAARLAATHGDTVNSLAAKSGLHMNGYGVTGVCLDSVALIEQTLSGKASGFPLFMRDDVMKSEIKVRLKDKHRGDNKDLKLLQKAIDIVPSDVTGALDPTAKQRAIASMPWDKSAPPLQCVKDAMDILGM